MELSNPVPWSTAVSAYGKDSGSPESATYTVSGPRREFQTKPARPIPFMSATRMAPGTGPDGIGILIGEDSTVPPRFMYTTTSAAVTCARSARPSPLMSSR